MAFRGIGDDATDVANRQAQEALERRRLAEAERANRAQEALAASRQKEAGRQANMEMKLRQEQLRAGLAERKDEMALQRGKMAEGARQFDATMAQGAREFDAKQALDTREADRRAAASEFEMRVKGSEYERYMQAGKLEQENREGMKRAFADGFMGLLTAAAGNPVDTRDGRKLGIAPKAAVEQFNSAQAGEDRNAPAMTSFTRDPDTGNVTFDMKDPASGEESVEALNERDVLGRYIESLAARAEAATKNNDATLKRSADYGEAVMAMTLKTLMETASRDTRHFYDLEKLGVQASARLSQIQEQMAAKASAQGDVKVTDAAKILMDRRSALQTAMDALDPVDDKDEVAKMRDKIAGIDRRLEQVSERAVAGTGADMGAAAVEEPSAPKGSAVRTPDGMITVTLASGQRRAFSDTSETRAMLQKVGISISK